MGSLLYGDVSVMNRFSGDKAHAINLNINDIPMFHETCFF